MLHIHKPSEFQAGSTQILTASINHSLSTANATKEVSQLAISTTNVQMTCLK